MLTLVLTRHGLTERSVPEQHLGQRLDVSITDAGRRQAQSLGRRLAGIPFDRVLTSPLFRARETAELVAPRARIEADPRLREMDYGAWEGRTYAEIDAHDAAFRRRWEATPDTLACPGGESGNDVAARVAALLEDLLEDHHRWHARTAFRATAGSAAAPPTERPILAVGHSSTNRILLCVALDVPVREYRRRFSQAQANLTAIRYEDGDGPTDGKLVLLNDVAHLRDPGEPPWE